jgi:hypothetical protein
MDRGRGRVMGGVGPALGARVPGGGATGARRETAPVGSSSARGAAGGLCTAALNAGSSSGTGAPIAAAAAAAATAAAAVAAPSAGGVGTGRGAGPDHREVRYAEGVLAMINVLRLLSLGGPRTWDHAQHSATGMARARRPAPGSAGREVNLLANHFAVGLPPGVVPVVYAVRITPHGLSDSSDTAADGVPCAALAQRVVEALAAEAGWPSGWALTQGCHGLVCGQAFLGTDQAAAVVTLPSPCATSPLQPGHGATDGPAPPSGASETSNITHSMTYNVTLCYQGSAGLADGAVPGAGLLGGSVVLEALLRAAALTAPTAVAAVPTPTPAVAALVGGQQQAGTCGSPGACNDTGGGTGASAITASGPPSPAALVGDTAAAAPYLPTPSPTPPSPGSVLPGTDGTAQAQGCAPPALLATVPRVRVGDAVFLHAPGVPELHVPLGGAVEGWLGFRQRLLSGLSEEDQQGDAMSQGMGQGTGMHSPAALQLDLTAAPFFVPGPLLPALPGLLSGLRSPLAGDGAGTMASPLATPTLTTLDTTHAAALGGLLCGVRVQVTLPGRRVRSGPVRGISHLGADSMQLTLRCACVAGPAGASVTVAAYMAAVHGVALVAPGLPCLDVALPGCGPGPLWYPLELVSLAPWQRYPAPLGAGALAALGRLGAKRPGERRAWLEALAAGLGDAAGMCGAGAPGAAAGAGCPLMVSPMPAVLRGRVLPPPHLAYGTPECVFPGSQGQWNVRACRLPGPCRIASWALVALMAQADIDVEGPAGVLPFLADLTAGLGAAGVDVALPPVVYEQVCVGGGDA